jgi:hypothetical protein
MATFTWATPESIQSALTTQLDALGNAVFSASSSAIDNLTNLYQYIDLEVVLGSLSPTAGAYVDVWLEPTLDGSNYADHGKALQTSHLLCSLQLDTAAATAQRLVKTNVPIPPYSFKLALRNGAGVALNASGNTLKFRRHNEQGV